MGDRCRYWFSCDLVFHVGGEMKDYDKQYAFLVELRDSGTTNMWGAAPYLVQEFGCSNEEAKKVLLAWMASFKD